MLLRGLTWLVLFQLIGTAINHLLLPVLPGPIIGLLLMLGYLVWRGEVGEPLSLAASSLLDPKTPLAPVNRRISITIMTREAEARLMGNATIAASVTNETAPDPEQNAVPTPARGVQKP